MIYDCFTFFNEFDLLEIRLHEMDPWVDYFVLVESGETFSGNPKPLWFAENKDRFKSFLPKIIHLISSPVDKVTNAWERQAAQRNFAMEVLGQFDDDLILIGDVDEIVRGQNFTKVQSGSEKMTTFVHQNYFYYMNFQRPGGWPGTVMLPYKMLISLFGGSLWAARKHRRGGRQVPKGGWHFSNMGGKENIRLKLKSSCHFNIPSYKRMFEDEDYLDDLMDGKERIKGRSLSVVPIDNHPVWFVENIGRFQHLMKEDKNNESSRTDEKQGNENKGDDR